MVKRQVYELLARGAEREGRALTQHRSFQIPSVAHAVQAPDAARTHPLSWQGAPWVHRLKVQQLLSAVHAEAQTGHHGQQGKSVGRLY